MDASPPRVRRDGRGGYDLSSTDGERELLASLPEQFREVSERVPADPALGRLFPPAYEDDQEANAEYEALTRDDLTSQRLHAMQVLEETAREDHLDEEQLVAWLGAINELRLGLGTTLDV